MERRTENGVIGDSVMAHSPIWLKSMAVLAFGFGALTIVSGGGVLFGDNERRAAAGDVVPFVLQFNTGADFAYVLAAAGLFLGRRWAARLALLIALATTAVFAAFGWHLATGGAFEPRTVVAMALRSVFWILLAIGAHRVLDSGQRLNRFRVRRGPTGGTLTGEQASRAWVAQSSGVSTSSIQVVAATAVGRPRVVIAGRAT